MQQRSTSMDIMSLANDALISYIKGKVANIGIGSLDVSKLINVAEMVPAAKECWEKLSGDNQNKLVQAIAALGKGQQAASLLGGLAGAFKKS